VYTLRASGPEEDSHNLEEIAILCSHNAKVCRGLGQRGKEKSWYLVADIVRGRIGCPSTKFDGWGGRSGGALTSGVIENLLRYYERLGDVQMLSTLVCVLRANADKGKRSQGSLFLSSEPECIFRYDSYIRKYADLLYGWGLLTLRAELLKNLNHSQDAKQIGGFEGQGESRLDLLGDIAVSFKCPRCTNLSDIGTNYCRSCRDFAFRCAICENAIRGLFTVCDKCGHGGHVNHVSEWFRTNESCPTGCGCKCRHIPAAGNGQREVDMVGGSTRTSSPNDNA
jgi:Zinc-ribbon, C4HC2 type